MSAIDWKEELLDFEFAEGSIKLVCIENLIVAFLVGMGKGWEWGIGTFLILSVMYCIPILGGTLGYFVSFAETVVVYEIVKNHLNATFTMFFLMLIFVLIISFHMVFGSIRTGSTMAFSLIIFEAVFLAYWVYYMSHSLPGAITTFVLLCVLEFVPVVRVIEYVVMAIWGSYLFYALFLSTVPKTPLIIGTVIVFLVQSVLFLSAFFQLDYAGKYSDYKNRKLNVKKFVEYKQIENEMYRKYPKLQDLPIYYKTCVCTTDEERNQFEQDWRGYIEYLNTCSEFIEFNQYFEMLKIYLFHFYNRDYVKRKTEGQYNSRSAEQTFKENNDRTESSWFVGIKNVDELKKRYRDLMKIYHPDNQAGDTNTVQQIQQEYEKLLKEHF